MRTARGSNPLKRKEHGTADDASPPPKRRPVSSLSLPPRPDKPVSDEPDSEREYDFVLPREEDPDDLLYFTSHTELWSPVEDTPHMCNVCYRECTHTTAKCPYLLHAAELGVFQSNPSEDINYFIYAKECYGGQHYTGFINRFAPPNPEDVERIAAEVMGLHEDGLNLVRITDIPKANDRPKQLYKQFKKIGSVTHVTVFSKQGVGFVNFKSVEAAERAMKELTCSGCGLLAWATQTSG